MNWTVPNTESLLRRLTKPKGKIDVVLDTDTYNELDDQFALSYMMKNSDKLNVKALYAAPFLNDKSVLRQSGNLRNVLSDPHLRELQTARRALPHTAHFARQGRGQKLVVRRISGAVHARCKQPIQPA